MSKRNAALEALTKPAANIVELPTGGSQENPPVNLQPPLAARPTVANTAARAMLYLPPRAKRKFREIAFHEDRKEHDVYMEALREYLERRGHSGLL
jgi:hypothetical protein